jgi:hypothetical protein
MERNPEELTTLERREQIIGELVMRYTAILQDGRFDRAFNTLSAPLYYLRNIQDEIEKEERAS